MRLNQFLVACLLTVKQDIPGSPRSGMDVPVIRWDALSEPMNDDDVEVRRMAVWAIRAVT